MSKINPLLFSPSPREIPEVYEALKNTGYDRLYSKYFPEEPAYNHGLDFFLAAEKYTHFVICPDDLVVEKKHIESLIADLEENDYHILSGVCNVNNEDMKNLLNVCTNLPHPTRNNTNRGIVGWRTFNWITKDYEYSDKPIQKFPFSGFAAQFLSRELMEKVQFTDDGKFNKDAEIYGGSLDVMFSNAMAYVKVPIMVDLRVRMHHIRGSTVTNAKIGDGEVRFYRANKDDFEIIYAEPKGIKKKWRVTEIDGKVKGGSVLR